MKFIHSFRLNVKTFGIKLKPWLYGHFPPQSKWMKIYAHWLTGGFDKKNSAIQTDILLVYMYSIAIPFIKDDHITIGGFITARIFFVCKKTSEPNMEYWSRDIQQWIHCNVTQMTQIRFSKIISRQITLYCILLSFEQLHLRDSAI